MVVLTGMRQVGKSTLLTRDPAFSSRRYINLDDFGQLEAAKQAPESLLKGDDPITIDEVQRCPELLMTIKRLVDKERKAGRFLLSGSASLPLLAKVSETLAGRALYLSLHPFSQRELSGDVASEPFLVRMFHSPEVPAEEVDSIDSREVLQGGMPSVCLGEVSDASRWFRGYEQTYLERDLRALSQVGDLIAFRHLMHLAALRSGQLLSTSELARDAKLNSVTASRYLGLMEAGFLVHRLPPYLGNRASRLIKSPKLFFADSGLACYLAGIGRLDPAAEEPLRGAMFETYVAENLLSILQSHWSRARLLFWNVQGRHEVDFVIEAGQETVAIEVKVATRWGDEDLSGLKIFLDKTPRCRMAILASNHPRAVQLGDRLYAIPLRLLLG